MKFVLLVEGYTERVLPSFLKRWIDPRLGQSVRIQVVRFQGWSDLVKHAPDTARRNLEYPEVIAVVSLLDLYGPNFYPDAAVTPPQRSSWAKQHLEKLVGHPRFRQHFAVHEIEAWLLSDPNILPTPVQQALPDRAKAPETVNSHEPPKVLLKRLYNARLKRDFRPLVDGAKLFAQLDPNIAYTKCPSLKAMLDDMLALAKGTP